MSEPSFGAGFAAGGRGSRAARAHRVSRLCQFDRGGAGSEIRVARSAGAAPRGAGQLDIGCGPGDDVLAMAKRVGDLRPRHRHRLERRGDRGSAAASAGGAAGDVPRGGRGSSALRRRLGRARSGRTGRSSTWTHPRRRWRRWRVSARRTASSSSASSSTSCWSTARRRATHVAQAIRDRFWSQTERRSWLGFMLPMLMHRVGLEASRDAARGSDHRLRRDRCARASACPGGPSGRATASVTRADATRWLNDLEHRATEGHVSLRMRFFHFVGRLPAS